MLPSREPDAVTLAVLAGGAGSRMGRPKGTLTVAGVPVLRHLLDRLAWPGPTLLVTGPGRERPPAADGFDAEATDPVAGPGPRRGGLTAIDAVGTDAVLVVTVDMPAVTPEQLRWMLSTAPAAAALMASRTLNGTAQVEPFPLRIDRSLGAAVAARLSAGRRSVHALAAEPTAAVVPAPPDWPASVWTNLNTPAEWAAFDAAKP